MDVSIMLSLTVVLEFARAFLKLRSALILYCADMASYVLPRSSALSLRARSRQAASKTQAKKPASLAAIRIQYGTMTL